MASTIWHPGIDVSLSDICLTCSSISLGAGVVRHGLTIMSKGRWLRAMDREPSPGVTWGINDDNGPIQRTGKSNLNRKAGSKSTRGWGRGLGGVVRGWLKGVVPPEASPSQSGFPELFLSRKVLLNLKHLRTSLCSSEKSVKMDRR